MTGFPALAVAIALVALTASMARADARLDYVASGTGCVPVPTAVAVQGSRLRIDMRDAGSDSSLLYDGVEQYATALDHEQRMASPIELDDEALDFQTDVSSATGTRMTRELDKVDAMMAQAREQMKVQCAELERQGMQCPQMAMPDLASMMQPENLQAMQQQAMVQADPADLRRAGIDPDALAAQQAQDQAQAAVQQARRESVLVDGLGADSVAGIACTMWERRQGEHVLERGCSVEPAALGLDARDQRGLDRGYARLMKMQQAFQPLVDKLDARMGTAQAGAGASAPGIVLRQACFDAEGRETGSATARIERATLPASTFEIPPGYRSPMDAMREDASQ